MATRRQQPFTSPSNDTPASFSSTTPSQDDASSSSDPLQRSNITPAVPTATILKLALFTVLMFVAPLSAYYLSAATFFAHNKTYAGALAAVVANLVVVGYVVVAVLEDRGDREEEERERKAKAAGRGGGGGGGGRKAD